MRKSQWLVIVDEQRAGSGLARALEDHLDDWSEQTGVRVEIWALPKSEVPPEVAEVVLATVVHTIDSLTHHAGAGQVSVAVTVGRSGLRLTLSNDGPGAPPGTLDEGLVPMKADFAALGGALSVNDVPRGGTTVSGAIPAQAVTMP